MIIHSNTLKSHFRKYYKPEGVVVCDINFDPYKSLTDLLSSPVDQDFILLYLGENLVDCFQKYQKQMNFWDWIKLSKRIPNKLQKMYKGQYE